MSTGFKLSVLTGEFRTLRVALLRCECDALYWSAGGLARISFTSKQQRRKLSSHAKRFQLTLSGIQRMRARPPTLPGKSALLPEDDGQKGENTKQ